jgi:hypothetical protein
MPNGTDAAVEQEPEIRKIDLGELESKFTDMRWISDETTVIKVEEHSLQVWHGGMGLNIHVNLKDGTAEFIYDGEDCFGRADKEETPALWKQYLPFIQDTLLTCQAHLRTQGRELIINSKLRLNGKY